MEKKIVVTVPDGLALDEEDVLMAIWMYLAKSQPETFVFPWLHVETMEKTHENPS